MAPTLPAPTFSSRGRRAITISSSSSSSHHGAKITIILVSSSSSSVVMVPVSNSGGDEATSRRKRKPKYRCWDLRDEVKILSTIAELRKANLGELPPASVLLEALGAGAALRRRGVTVLQISQKVYHLKRKFEAAVARTVASGGRRLRNYRNRTLYEVAKEVWPDVLADPVATAHKVSTRVRV